MNLKQMKSTAFAAVLLASFTFAGCGENKKEGAAAHDEHAGMNHEMESAGATGAEVVKVPDYAAAGDPVKQQLNQLLANYLKMKDALVASNAPTAQAEAKALVASAEQIKVDALQGEQKEFAQEKIEKVKESASKIAQANELNTQRENLESISEATYSLVKAFDVADQTLYYQHCPMANNDKGGYWLSSNKEVRNPYFGDQMLKCGSTAETLN